MEKGIISRDEMRSPSASLGRLVNDNENPYQNLANAIVCVAADDYRAALKKNDEQLLDNLRQFFYSAWCGVLTGIDIEALVESLEAEQCAICLTR